MTIAIRVVATLLLDPARGVIKGQQFRHDRVIGEPIQWARVMAQLRSVDEVMVLDVTHGPPDIPLLQRISAECFIPLSYGGGIYDTETAVRLIRSGCDKVVLQPKQCRIFEQTAKALGAQAVVMCANDLDQWAVWDLRYVGEILLQSTTRDGMMVGYALDDILAVRKRFPEKPIIASSGAGTPEHCVAAVRAGADAVAAGAMWAFRDVTPNDVKAALKASGYPIRAVAA